MRAFEPHCQHCSYFLPLVFLFSFVSFSLLYICIFQSLDSNVYEQRLRCCAQCSAAKVVRQFQLALPPNFSLCQVSPQVDATLRTLGEPSYREIMYLALEAACLSLGSCKRVLYLEVLACTYLAPGPGTHGCAYMTRPDGDRQISHFLVIWLMVGCLICLAAESPQTLWFSKVPRTGNIIIINSYVS